MSDDKAERLRNPGDSHDEPEEPLWRGGYSAKAMYGSWLGAMLLSVILLVAGFMIATVGVVVALCVVVVIWALLGIQLLIRKIGVDYELTTQRFIHKVGILSRKTDRIELIDVDDVSYVQGIIQRMLGVGSIKVTSSDRSHPELNMIGIDGVEKVADMIDDARRQERRRRGLHIEAI